MKYILLTVALFACNPARACGNGECDPEPPTHEPEKIDHERPGVLPASHDGCTCSEFQVPWGLNSYDVREAKARKRCEEKRRTVLHCAITDPELILNPRLK